MKSTNVAGLLALLAAVGCASTETDTRAKKPADTSKVTAPSQRPAPVASKPVELDGIWQREDGKLYAICDDRGEEGEQAGNVR